MNAAITTMTERILPAEADGVKWGLHVLHCGSIECPPHTPYISGEDPDYPWWEKGRKLDLYILEYIVRGRGVFQSEETGLVRVHAGDAMLLFPGVWHRYRPFSRTGWHELWIGFDGDYARQLMSRFFSPEKAILHLGRNDELVGQMLSVQDLVQVAPPGYQQIMAGRTLEVLARVRSLAQSFHAADRVLAGKIQQARCALMEQAETDIDLDGLARDLGMSYSHFRTMFKAETGISPHQYQLEIRMGTARNLLSYSRLPVSAIADRLGFSSVYYFSRLFKKRTGLSPTQYRKQ